MAWYKKTLLLTGVFLYLASPLFWIPFNMLLERGLQAMADGAIWLSREVYHVTSSTEYASFRFGVYALIVASIPILVAITGWVVTNKLKENKRLKKLKGTDNVPLGEYIEELVEPSIRDINY